MVREIVGALVMMGLVGAADAGPRQASGVVRGSVVTGPVCPGPARLDSRECAPQPRQASIKVFAATDARGDAKPLTTIVSDRDGRFQVTLPAGVYRLVPASPGGVSIGKPRDVTVVAGSIADVQLVIDTGMR